MIQLYNRYVKIKQIISQSYRPYRQSIDDIVRYRTMTWIVSGISISLLNYLAMVLIRSTGRVAITSGDFDFLFKSWQGPFIIILGLGILFLYVVFDLNTQIIYASKILHGKADLFGSIKEGFLSIPKFFTIDGIGIILYIALIAPIIGFGLSISLTEGLYIPTFISSVIASTPVYNLLYHTAIIVFFIIGTIHIFILHGILLSGLPSNKADDESRELMKNNWKDFVKQNLLFFLSIIAVNLFVFITLLLIPGVIALILMSLFEIPRAVGFFLLLLCAVATIFVNNFFPSFYLIRITQLYYEYKGEKISFVRDIRKKNPVWNMMKIAAVILCVLILSIMLDRNFEEILPVSLETQIIAHRGGGIEAPENSIAGIEKAIELGASGSEIDIQRTKDGYYIVNHDGNFSRLCSNPAKPSQLTLDEVKDLLIRDPNYPDDPQDVATFEEMLDAAKGRITLFVELKGDSADFQMVDDAVRMIKERDMADECVLISLKYNLIDYAERKYPEMQTGYLTFVSFGSTSQLNCDYLGLEEESATANVIDAIHDSGRKVLIWTPNEAKSQNHFLTSKADFIITDEISQANDQIRNLSMRSDLEIFLDWIVSLI